MIFYAIQGLMNALLLALFAVAAFVDHPQCYSTGNHTDITKRFTLTYQVGFYMHALVFINQTYIDPYC